MSRDETVADGWFGPDADAHQPGSGTWWSAAATGTRCSPPGEPDLVARLVAFPGSWTAAEMRVPLLLVRGGVRRTG